MHEDSFHRSLQAAFDRAFPPAPIPDAEFPQPGYGDPRLPQHFWDRVFPEPTPTGCWEWVGGKTDQGYGSLRLIPGGPPEYAHRVSYVGMVGAIPPKMVIDHLCRNRGCVNPVHLEPVPHAENIRRGLAIRTHCPRGHEYTTDNTLLASGARKCRTCQNARRRKGFQGWDGPSPVFANEAPMTPEEEEERMPMAEYCTAVTYPGFPGNNSRPPEPEETCDEEAVEGEVYCERHLWMSDSWEAF